MSKRTKQRFENFNARQVAIILQIKRSQVVDLIKRHRMTGRHYTSGWKISREELISVCVFSGISTRWTEFV